MFAVLSLSVGSDVGAATCVPPLSTLTASTTETNANDRVAVLSLTLSGPVCFGDPVVITDDAGSQVGSVGSNSPAGTYTFSVTPPNLESRTYTSNRGGSVTVTNVGWNGTVTLSTDRSQVNANDRTAALTVTLSKEMVSPYYVCVHNQSGAQMIKTQFESASGSSWVVNTSATPGNLETWTVTAYVAKSCTQGVVPTPELNGVIRQSNSVSVENVGWNGTVTLSTDRSQVNANDRTAALTVTLSKEMVSPYYVCVHNQSGAQMIKTQFESASGSSWVVNTSATPGNLETWTVTAYVAKSCTQGVVPTPELNGVIRQSNSVTVENVGWNGTVELTSDRDSVDVNSPGAVLRLATSKPVVSPYYACLYNDESNGRYFKTQALTSNTDGTYSINQAVTLQANEVVNYTAIVSTNCPSPGPYDDTSVARSAETTVTNEGWTGTLTLEPVAQTGAPGTDFVISVSKPVPSPYYVSLYGPTGQLFVGGGGSVTNWTVSAVPPASGSANFTAYVSQGALPQAGGPTLDVRQLAGVVFVAGVISDEIIDGVSAAALAEWFALDVEAEQLALEICATRVGQASGNTGSICNAGEAVIEADVAAQGLTGIARFRKLLKAASVAAPGVATALWLTHVDQAGAPAPPAQPTQPSPPPTEQAITPPPAIAGPPTYQQVVRADFRLRMRVGKRLMTDQEADRSADRCIEQVKSMRSFGVSISGNACRELDVFLPGGNYPTSTQFITEAMYGTNPEVRHNAAWGRLTYMRAPDRMEELRLQQPGFPRNWYLSQPATLTMTGPDPACAAALDWECDEYPFLASQQSGPESLAGPPGAALKRVVAADNKGVGRRYGNFAQSCLAHSTATAGANGKAFLVVPVTALPLTGWACLL